MEIKEKKKGPLYIFAPGWSYGPELWRKVASYFPEEDSLCLDLRKGHKETIQEISVFIERFHTRPIVGVGHSMGFLWLLEYGASFITHWVSINGFGCFGANETFPEGISPRYLMRMKRRLDDDSRKVIKDFRLKIGDHSSHDISMDTGKCVSGLREGLELLEKSDHRIYIINHMPHLLRIEGRNDPLLSENMQHASFNGQGELYQIENGGHVLPLTHPQKCLELMACFLASKNK